jgi:hypothetical protein
MEAEAHQPSDNDSAAIDVVIAWVDGNDPKLKEKRENYLNGHEPTNSSSLKATRFASVKEINYCVLSILKFAPFVRNIFIVTDDQDPNIHEDIKKYFPERVNSVKIVDHKEIFRGYEDALPTFNSITIGNMVWRIDGLSENFVYFNDDIFLIRDIKPTEWVINNRPVLMGHWSFPPYKKIIFNKIKWFFYKTLTFKKNYQTKFSFFLVQWNTASLLGMKIRYFLNGHTPHVINKKTIENFFNKKKELFEKNISYHFREQVQFNISTLSNHLEILSGNKQIAKSTIGYLNPAYHKDKRFDRKLRECETDTRIKSICVQSLDMATPNDQERIFNMLNRFLKN